MSAETSHPFAIPLPSRLTLAPAWATRPGRGGPEVSLVAKVV